MELILPEAELYAQHHTSPMDALSTSLLDDTMQTHAHAHMISGALQGKFLELCSLMIRPKHILEIGTFTGFSALCLCRGLQEGGELHTIEMREADAQKAQTYFNQSLYANQIKLHVGDAKTIIPQLEESWDLVFIDADKVGYIEYYELTLPRLKTGGYILADNVLFHGQVLQQPLKGKNALAIDAFNQHVKNDDRVEQVMLTVRDGLTLIRKK